MRKSLLSGVLALLLIPAFATASPSKFDPLHTQLDNRYLDPSPYSCSSGGADSLVIGAVVCGLIARRRRR